MGGILATGLVAISDDLSDLRDGGFWAVSTTFEGKSILAKFDQIQRSAPFPNFDHWQSLESNWRSSQSKVEYLNYVEEIRNEIAKGEVYQVNACRVLETEYDGPSLGGLFQLLLAENPSPQASFLRLPGIEIASASPELFLERDGDLLKSSPIKGSRPVSKKPLAFSEKDQSENVMIVDLMRNDLSQICESVEVGAILRNEIHPGIEHLVSDVFGRLRKGVDWPQIIKQLSPAGSISGAPKISALKIIKRMEKVPRGPYCGLLGWIEGDLARLSVAIRIFWREGLKIKFGTGAGITWSSDAAKEWDETQLKAGRLIGLCGGYQENDWPFGSGLFETLRVEDGKIQFLSEHLDRAKASAQQLGMKFPSDSTIMEKLSELPRVRLGRLRLTFGESFHCNLLPYVDPRAPLKIVTTYRNPEYDLSKVGHKLFPYDSNLDLLSQVRSRGFDETIIVNESLEISEGSISNFVFRIDGFWITPPRSSGLLPGIIRQKVLDAGLAIEASIAEEQIKKVTHAFAISSLRIATPVETIDGRVLNLDDVSKAWNFKLRDFLKMNSVG